MDLAQRKQQVLSAVVENYIATGEPVGSKTLQNELFSNVSSATIRNDMADLTANGYLDQPHTSAGRVPTSQGYRYYIERLMQKKNLDPRIQDYIDDNLRQYADAPENILNKASQVLSEITGLIAVTSTPPGEDARVHKIRFVQTGRYTSMVVLITSTGMVKSKLFRSEFVVNNDILQVFDRALNERLAGIKLQDITQPFIQTLAASFGDLSLFMPSVLLAIKETAEAAELVNISISGQPNILFLPDVDLISGRNILQFLGNTKAIASLLHRNYKGTKVYIGQDSDQPELRSSAVVVTRYEIAGQTAGALALLGPIRIDYASVISSLEYTAETVSSLIDEIIEN